MYFTVSSIVLAVHGKVEWNSFALKEVTSFIANAFDKSFDLTFRHTQHTKDSWCPWQSPQNIVVFRMPLFSYVLIDISKRVEDHCAKQIKLEPEKPTKKTCKSLTSSTFTVLLLNIWNKNDMDHMHQLAKLHLSLSGIFLSTNSWLSAGWKSPLYAIGNTSTVLTPGHPAIPPEVWCFTFQIWNLRIWSWMSRVS